MIGITLGDANGVGPEILVRCAAAGELPAPFCVYGDAVAIRYAADRLGIDPCVVDAMDIRDLGLLDAADITPGRMSASVGAAAVDYVTAATAAALAGTIDAIVTLPLHKAAARLSRPDFTGHTELIAELCGNPPVTMMLAGRDLIVTHVSTHVPLAMAVQLVTVERVLAVIRLTHAAVVRLRPQARIAVAGLNPHAGEHGAFGNEDQTAILPAVAAARAEGIDAYGPEPADTVFYNTVQRRRFDAVVCMYHDQGHIPMKTLDFDGGVNVTLGLPIVRTSVDHGTAYDIAYQGQARTTSFRAAVALARQLTGTPT